MKKKILLGVAAIGLWIFGYRFYKSPAPAAAATQPVARATASRVDRTIETVQAGFLPGFNSKPVGKAFEYKFQNARWNSFQTPNGETMVDFSGTIRSDILVAAGLYASRANPIIVRSDCINSLGLRTNMAEEAKSARASEVAFISTLADINERRVSSSHDAPSQRSAKEKENTAAVTARKQQEKAEKKLSEDNEAKIEACIDSVPLPVKFQFKVAANKEKFELGYIDSTPFGSTAPDRVLAFVYR